MEHTHFYLSEQKRGFEHRLIFQFEQGAPAPVAPNESPDITPEGALAKTQKTVEGQSAEEQAVTKQQVDSKPPYIRPRPEWQKDKSVQENSDKSMWYYNHILAAPTEKLVNDLVNLRGQESPFFQQLLLAHDGTQTLPQGGIIEGDTPRIRTIDDFRNLTPEAQYRAVLRAQRLTYMDLEARADLKDRDGVGGIGFTDAYYRQNRQSLYQKSYATLDGITDGKERKMETMRLLYEEREDPSTFKSEKRYVQAMKDSINKRYNVATIEPGQVRELLGGYAKGINGINHTSATYLNYLNLNSKDDVAKFLTLPVEEQDMRIEDVKADLKRDVRGKINHHRTYYPKEVEMNFGDDFLRRMDRDM